LHEVFGQRDAFQNAFADHVLTYEALKFTGHDHAANLQKVADNDKTVAGPDDFAAAVAAVREIHIEPELRGYITSVTRATREHEAVELGVSPRGTLSLFRATQAMAALRGRPYATPDDTKAVAASVLTHRMILSPDARLRGRTVDHILAEVLGRVEAPVEQVTSN
jgi:MoxR-like ATPase